MYMSGDRLLKHMNTVTSISHKGEINSFHIQEQPVMSPHHSQYSRDQKQQPAIQIWTEITVKRVGLMNAIQVF